MRVGSARTRALLYIALEAFLNYVGPHLVPGQWEDTRGYSLRGADLHGASTRSAICTPEGAS